MRIKTTTLLLLCGFWATPTSAFDVTPEINQELEVIEVYGQKGLRALRSQYEASRREFRNMFNGLVEDKRFVVRCKRRKPFLSHIIKETCRPAFYWARLHDRAQYALWFGFALPNAPADIYSFPERREYNATLMKMLNENKELQRKFFSFLVSQHIYMDAHILEHGDLSRFKSDLARSTKLLSMLIDKGVSE